MGHISGSREIAVASLGTYSLGLEICSAVVANLLILQPELFTVFELKSFGSKILETTALSKVIRFCVSFFLFLFPHIWYILHIFHILPLLISIAENYSCVQE